MDCHGDAALAIGERDRYSVAAMRERFRRLSALILAFAIIVAGATQGIQASDMAVKMTAVSTGDNATPQGCTGCGADDNSSGTACFAVCGTTVVGILPPAMTISAGVLLLPVAPVVFSSVGRHWPPDPYPPRPDILG